MLAQVSVCPQGGSLPHCMLGYTPRSRGRHTPQLEADTPLDQRQTPILPPQSEADIPLHSACWDTVNKRAVRIPLECFLVCTSVPYSQYVIYKPYSYPLTVAELVASPQDPTFFEFHVVFGKIWQNGMLSPPGGFAPSPTSNPGSTPA